MALDIFFSEDIRNALLAATEASSSTARVCAAAGGDQVTIRAYLEGYEAALTAVALSFGLSPAIVTAQRATPCQEQEKPLKIEGKIVVEEGNET